MGHPGFLVVLAMWIFDLIVGLENAEILRWESFVVRTTPLPRMTGMWGIGSRFVVLGSQLVAAVKWVWRFFAARFTFPTLCTERKGWGTRRSDRTGKLQRFFAGSRSWPSDSASSGWQSSGGFCCRFKSGLCYSIATGKTVMMAH